jgi:hypothetical protein
VTPTPFHFGTTLLLSALVRVPWQSIILAAALWGSSASADLCTFFGSGGSIA